ncbi:phosphoprotein [Cardamom vein clearing nucleorhabdovirus 1]|uniref:Phosphoprotein n=1 Tax=cardamom vein clearing virus TaxID=2849749 RepID=A0A6M6R532_9RHAB|nr:phosphoprotein [Cardamom vein clearing nucleorhabdovirus 1]QJZ27980.1 phosphoprotein [Cardamom vein clearing nucleorhabdovirus 1]
MQDAINEKYKSLSQTAINSEVVTSKYASEAVQAGYEGDPAKVAEYMQGWNNIMQGRSIEAPSGALEVLGEVSNALIMPGNEKLVGRLADTLLTIVAENRKQLHMMPQTMVIEMESAINRLHDEISLLQKTERKIAESTVRKKISPKRMIVPTGEEKKPVAPEGDTSTKEDEQPQKKEKGKEDTPGAEDQHQGKCDNLSELLQKLDIDTTLYSFVVELDLASDKAKSMRSAYAAHYNSEQFSTLPTEKQNELLVHYVTHLINIVPATILNNEAAKVMVRDLIDKERVIKSIRKLNNDQLTQQDLQDSVTELYDAIEACSYAYGNFVAEMIQVNGRPSLLLKEDNGNDI